LSDLEFMPLGVGVARRGWLTRRDVLNTLTAAELRRELKGAAQHGHHAA